MKNIPTELCTLICTNSPKIKHKNAGRGKSILFLPIWSWCQLVKSPSNRK